MLGIAIGTKDRRMKETHMVPAFMGLSLWKEKEKNKTKKPEVRLLGLP